MSDLDAQSTSDFHSARAKGFFQRLVAVLADRPRVLLGYDEVRGKLHLGGPVYRGLQTVPLKEIIGSVDRYLDFDRRFLPTQSHTAERWRRVNRAWYQEIALPPVLLYKVGEVYFVVDGNHRVSVARHQGQVYIDAEVRECAARVPVTGETRAEDLERLEDRVEFLERTQLDRLRPEAVVVSTLLGGYDRLIEHIAVHRYFMGIDQQQDVSEGAAVIHWFDEVYQPVASVVEESGILKEFPGRTNADLYLWVMDHLHFLRSDDHRTAMSARDAAEDFVDWVHED